MSQHKKKGRKEKAGYYKRDNDIPKQREVNVNIDSEEDEDETFDFSYLQNKGSFSGSHFLLKSEQEKFQSESIVNNSKYFNVDLKLLNLAIQSIPFYERHNIEKDIKLLSSEIDQMKNDTSIYEEAYRELLEKNLKAKTAIEIQVEQTSKALEEIKVHKNSKVAEQENSLASVNDRTNMEKWLDNILDL